jgi:hypothetical protein
MERRCSTGQSPQLAVAPLEEEEEEEEIDLINKLIFDAFYSGMLFLFSS